MIYGYARVSSDGQSEAAQVRQLRSAGAGKVFREIASGAKTDRPHSFAACWRSSPPATC
jgi:DNA invertase Pin-like site-specific DNA recombinase